MKTTYDRQAREERAKEKEIKLFNDELKTKPELLNNEVYLFLSMDKLRLKLKQLPAQHHDNLLLITEYFKTPRDHTNFKQIKPEILNNKLFIYQALKKNPELYFFISQDNQKEFKRVAIYSDSEYLKYLDHSDYDSPVLCKHICFNLNSFQDSLSCIKINDFNKILQSEHSKYLVENIWRLNKEQCQYLKEPLVHYLEKNLEDKGIYWFHEQLKKNPYLYTILDSDKYKNELHKNTLVSIACSQHDLFTYLPAEWKADFEIISKVIQGKQNNTYGQHYQQSVIDISLVLNDITQPQQFVQEKLNDSSMLYIRKIYPQLSLEWRNQEPIIKNLFKARDGFDITLDFCRSIPHEDLADELSEKLKTFKYRSLDLVGKDLEIIVNHYFLKNTISSQNTSSKKVKL